MDHLGLEYPSSITCFIRGFNSLLASHASPGSGGKSAQKGTARSMFLSYCSPENMAGRNSAGVARRSSSIRKSPKPKQMLEIPELKPVEQVMYKVTIRRLRVPVSIMPLQNVVWQYSKGGTFR